MSRTRAQVVAFTIAASLMIAPAVAGTPIDLPADPPTTKIDPGPSLSFGRVGPCPGCRTEPQGGLYNFITPKGPRPIEPVPGFLLEHPARQCCALNPSGALADRTAIPDPKPTPVRRGEYVVIAAQGRAGGWLISPPTTSDR